MITYANLTATLESPSLIGILMRAQTPDWPSGLVSMVVKQLLDKFEPQDTMSLFDTNHLQQQIGLKTLESNPQTMFEQIAALENQLKTPMSDSEKIAIGIKKFPAEYQPVLTVKMRKEGGMLMASHILRTLHFNIGGQYMVHTPRILSLMQQITKVQSWAKKLHLQKSIEPATDVVKEDIRRWNVMPRSILMVRP